MAIGIRDVRLIQRAVEQRWKLDEGTREKAITRLLKVIGSEESTDRAVISATKALIAMDALNQKDEHEQAKLLDLRGRILEIASHYGIGLPAVGSGETVEGRTDGGD